ncbi:MAG: aminotransferase class I/II-fold pyridoxal phosphate-dependent enzyme [Thermodesulfobacteria bacterium]|nr:aminotransferase class I/II-fold pyridoxal phosphate-dependent enzyme [Thermodesulfobacteriota bacterium]
MSVQDDKKRDFIPFCRPTIGDDEIAEVVDCLKSGWITTGPKTARFEQDFKDAFGPEQEAIAVNSATAGLHLSLLSLDLQQGDEVITTSITWPSTVNNIVICGARPVFADVDKDTLQIDVEDVARKMTSRTRAVIPVHFAGAPVDLDPLRQMCEARGVGVIEDAAHAAGTAYQGRFIGSDSQVAVFSFHPIKNMTTGEGGMILCNNREQAARMRRLRFHGISRDAWKRYSKGGSPQYEVIEPGFKYNMLDMQAALGIHQLRRLSEFNRVRAKLAQDYMSHLEDVEGVMPVMPPSYPHEHAWHLFVVRLELERLRVDRDEFIAQLQEEGVGVGLHFPAVHLQKFYRKQYGFTRGQLPNSEWNSDRLFSLPLYPGLSKVDQARVVETLEKLLKRNKR